jgi:hypothetical protein
MKELSSYQRGWLAGVAWEKSMEQLDVSAYQSCGRSGDGRPEVDPPPPTDPINEPCPSCPPIVGDAWSTFGPCKDGKWHRSECPIARAEMAAAKWPCGRLKYPEGGP